MQIRPQGWFYVAALAVLTSGCAAFDSGLPTGVTLLDSSREECAGSVALDDRIMASARREDLVIQRGQNGTFEVDADADRDVEIEWTCVGSANTERETIECPEDTSWVRVTRASGDDFLLECYGEGSSARRARR
jgi:hypothetical protein